MFVAALSVLAKCQKESQLRACMYRGPNVKVTSHEKRGHLVVVVAAAAAVKHQT